MIPEDAIWILELIRNRDARTEAEKDAVNAAIEALKAQLTREGTTKDATSDTISRQAALEKVRAMKAYKLFEDIILVDKAVVQTELMMLPSAQPEPKEGQWVNGCCNKCGGHAPFWAMASTYYKSDFCPHCGAKMKGAEHETN